MKASVILPTYNEADNIVDLVRSVVGHIPAGWDYEIIVVDDDSPDRTFQVVQAAFSDNPAVVPVLRTSDRGLAKAIRAGLERARGDRIVIMDTDFSHDPAEIPLMLHVAQMVDLVIGSRFCAGGGMQDTPHYIASLLYNWFVRLTLQTQIQDNLSGFLTIRRDALKALPYDSIFFGYGDYFFRLLHYAQKAGIRLIEVPVYYRAREKGASKSNYMRLVLSYTLALIRLKVELTRLP